MASLDCEGHFYLLSKRPFFNCPGEAAFIIRACYIAGGRFGLPGSIAHGDAISSGPEHGNIIFLISQRHYLGHGDIQDSGIFPYAEGLINA